MNTKAEAMKVLEDLMSENSIEIEDIIRHKNLKLYVVEGSSNEYEDVSYWFCDLFFDKGKAEAFVASCEAWVEEIRQDLALVDRDSPTPPTMRPCPDRHVRKCPHLAESSSNLRWGVITFASVAELEGSMLMIDKLDQFYSDAYWRLEKSMEPNRVHLRKLGESTAALYFQFPSYEGNVWKLVIDNEPVHDFELASNIHYPPFYEAEIFLIDWSPE